MKRSSAPMPVVAIHHSSTKNPTAPTPTSRRVMRGGGIRSAKSDCPSSVAIYFVAGAASAG